MIICRSLQSGIAKSLMLTEKFIRVNILLYYFTKKIMYNVTRKAVPILLHAVRIHVSLKHLPELKRGHWEKKKNYWQLFFPLQRSQAWEIWLLGNMKVILTLSHCKKKKKKLWNNLFWGWKKKRLKLLFRAFVKKKNIMNLFSEKM